MHTGEMEPSLEGQSIAPFGKVPPWGISKYLKHCSKGHSAQGPTVGLQPNTSTSATSTTDEENDFPWCVGLAPRIKSTV